MTSFIPPAARNSSCEKVMFSQTCVIHSVHGGGVPGAGVTGGGGDVPEVV